MSKLPNIVLVHGAWADGSSWSAVIERLQRDGFNVTAPQFALTKLSDDVARLREVLARQNGPTIVAGHSYGGPDHDGPRQRRAQRDRSRLRPSVRARPG